MRINKLEFSAVGPYKGRQVIDFDVLGTSALYLIDGPTGAGKSTIIDCIVYALFNEMSGEASDDARIRSHFADPSTETYVELTFTNANGKFKVRRSPEYMRPRARGEGLTPEKATAVLYRLESDGTVTSLATQPREVGPLLRDKIIGLTKAQFTQTVVLPQGEFATFLRAETRDREPLLSKIFATGIYQQVAAVLKDKAKAVGKESEKITQEILHLLAQFQIPVGYTAEQRTAISQQIEKSLDDEVVSEVAEAAASVKAEADNALAKTDKAQQQRTEAQKKLTSRQAERAAQVAVERDTADLAAKRQLLANELHALLSHTDTLVAANIKMSEDWTVDEWRGASSALSTLIGEIGAAKTAELRLEQFPIRKVELEGDIARFEAEIADLQKRVTELPQVIESLRQAADATAPKARISAIDGEIAALAEALKVHTELAALAKSADLKTAAVEEAQKEAATQQAARNELVTRRISGMASELASELKPGDACQVCGSTEHPRLAIQDESAVSAEDIADADAAVSRALAALDAARSAADTVTASIATLKSRITTDEQTIAMQQAELRTEKAGLTELVASADAAAEDLANAISELDTANGNLIAVTAEITDRRSKLDSESAQADADRIAVEAARGDFESVSDRSAALTRALSAIERTTEARISVGTAEAALGESTKVLESLPQHEQFADVDSATAEAESAEATYLGHKTISDSATERAALAERLAGDISTEIQRRSEVLADGRELIKLAEVFNKDAAGQGINIYVLQALFSDVLQSANARFANLLEGRYKLVVSDESDGHKSAVRGLGLNVLDTRTGEERSAKTLSGGESFCASLVLALGMADIVRAHAGGIAIETLFIDEGFGSLDGTRLNDVMNMLQGLQMSGRTVGVISHVDEMKGQIQERINVIPGGKDKPTTLEVTWMQ